MYITGKKGSTTKRSHTSFLFKVSRSRYQRCESSTDILNFLTDLSALKANKMFAILASSEKLRKRSGRGFIDLKIVRSNSNMLMHDAMYDRGSAQLAL